MTTDIDLLTALYSNAISIIPVLRTSLKRNDPRPLQHSNAHGYTPDALKNRFQYPDHVKYTTFIGKNGQKLCNFLRTAIDHATCVHALCLSKGHPGRRHRLHRSHNKKVPVAHQKNPKQITFTTLAQSSTGILVNLKSRTPPPSVALLNLSARSRALTDPTGKNFISFQVAKAMVWKPSWVYRCSITIYTGQRVPKMEKSYVQRSEKSSN